MSFILYKLQFEMICIICNYFSVFSAVLDVISLKYNPVSGQKLTHRKTVDLPTEYNIGIRIYKKLRGFDNQSAASSYDRFLSGAVALGDIFNCHAVKLFRHRSPECGSILTVLTETVKKSHCCPPPSDQSTEKTLRINNIPASLPIGAERLLPTVFK